jgi:hypothetical protein
MAQAVETLEDDYEYAPSTGGVARWLGSSFVWYGMSMVVHLLILVIVGLALGTAPPPKIVVDAPAFESVKDTILPEPQLDRFDVGETPLEPTVLDTESLTMLEPPKIEQTEQINDDSKIFTEAGGGFADSSALSLGGLGSFDTKSLGEGAAMSGAGGVGTGIGTSGNAGSGGAGEGFGGRGSGMRKAMLGGFGGTKQTERAVAAALSWLARHQSKEGNWSLQNYTQQCKDKTCTGPGAARSDVAATAFALLPFLAAGQTHETKGPFQRPIRDGLFWLVRNQEAKGNLARGSSALMYTHGLASIVLCEAYGLSKDETIGKAAQRAIYFIEEAQDPMGGGWRYQPQDPGDVSVVGWQVMALKSGIMAGLIVKPETLDKAKAFLKSCTKGKAGGMYSYMPQGGQSHVMTAVGMLCSQYMGAGRNDPGMIEGMQLLMRNLPKEGTKEKSRNIYYWYYATQVMHNLPGPEWDQWNRQMRRTLIETQVKEGCAAGSWDPMFPSKDAWGDQGGRLMMTSMSALSLEVYYRYLPLYQTGGSDALEGGEMKLPTSEVKAKAKGKAKE